MNFDSAKRVAAEFKAVATMASFRTEALHMDVSKADSVEHATNYMVENFGRIDYCINSAGVSSFQVTSTPQNPKQRVRANQNYLDRSRDPLRDIRG
jgi:NAD(P)-dependent dehydrogenase (short-subunit alcohol dehydrogenase family)